MLKTRFLKEKDRKIVLKRKHLTITLSNLNDGLETNVFNIVNRKKYVCKITKINEKKYLKDSQFTCLFDVLRTCIEKSQFACYILREPSSVDDTLDEFMLIRIRVEGGVFVGRKKKRKHGRKKKRKTTSSGQKYFWFVLRLRGGDDDDSEDPKPILKEELKPFSKVLKRVRFKIPRTTSENLNFSSSTSDDDDGEVSSSSTSSSSDSPHQLFKPRTETISHNSEKSRRRRPLIYPLLDDLQESSSEEGEFGKTLEQRNSSLFEDSDTIKFGSEESDDTFEEEEQNEYQFHFEPSKKKYRTTFSKNRIIEKNEARKRVKEKKNEIRLSSFENDEHPQQQQEVEIPQLLFDPVSSSFLKQEEKEESSPNFGIRICDIPILPSSNTREQRVYELLNEAEKLVETAEVTLTELKKGLFVM